MRDTAERRDIERDVSDALQALDTLESERRPLSGGRNLLLAEQMDLADGRLHAAIKELHALRGHTQPVTCQPPAAPRRPRGRRAAPSDAKRQRRTLAPVLDRYGERAEP